MLVIGGAVIGAILGGLTAKRRGGSRTDILHYTVVYGIVLALVGLAATLVIDRSLI